MLKAKRKRSRPHATVHPGRRVTVAGLTFIDLSEILLAAKTALRKQRGSRLGTVTRYHNWLAGGLPPCNEVERRRRLHVLAEANRRVTRLDMLLACIDTVLHDCAVGVIVELFGVPPQPDVPTERLRIELLRRRRLAAALAATTSGDPKSRQATPKVAGRPHP